MPIIDRIKDFVTEAVPQRKVSVLQPNQAGFVGGSYRGEDLILSKPFIIATSFQIFCTFIALCCFAGVASFQGKWKVGPSGLSILALFVSLLLLFLSSFLLAVPVIYDRHDKFRSLARALRETRVAAICNGAGGILSLLIAFITTISVFTEPGCKDPKKDPNASKGKAFQNGLSDWCRTKRAGAIFFWIVLIAWGITAFLAFQEWRTGKTVYKSQDPVFTRPAQPVEHHDEEDQDPYTAALRQPQRQATEDPYYNPSARNQGPFSDDHREDAYDNSAAGRPSMDAYGAFSDPNPSGYGQPDVSRTMQYADPYAAVRASVAPPSYDPYRG